MGYAFYYRTPIGQIIIGEKDNKITHILFEGTLSLMDMY